MMDRFVAEYTRKKAGLPALPHECKKTNPESGYPKPESETKTNDKNTI